ncbi:MAG: DNA polymerase III subunit beta [Candidatus Saccharimonadales bacterium]
MKLQVTQENLNRALNTVARVANSRNPLPVLANVLIKTSGNRLSIVATNLDIAITQYIGAKVSENGSITVPARLMQDFINSLPSSVIDLKLEDSRLHITTNKYNSVINGILADEFPVMPTVSGGTKWSIRGSLFRRGLQQVVFAASNDESRPVLTGVLIHTLEGKLYIAATDSYRLAEKELGDNKSNINLLIPASAMQDLLRIIGENDDEIQVTHDEQLVRFQVGDIELVARLLEGKYPDYRKLIPRKFTVNAKLKQDDFLNITKVSSLFARESAGSVTIEADETKQQLSIRSIASQLGENTANATAKVSGNGSITLNSRYLLDALQAISGEDVTFGFNGKLEPTLIKDTASVDYSHIIMPLKS